MAKRGLLVVISAPSGGGKSTLIQRVLATGDPDHRYSISATTRPRRPNEEDGRDYYFLGLDDFKKKQESGAFIEAAEVHGWLYATPKEDIDNWLSEGKVVFLDVDVDGGLAIKEKYGDAATLIFIKPPSFESLIERLRERNTESQTQIDKRLNRYPKEIMKSKYYDHVIVNEDLDQTVGEILKLVERETARPELR